VNFNHIAFSCELFYDAEDMKQVDYIKDKPFQFKAKPNERGDQVQLELRLKVLTSQHEDMFFIVSIQGFDPHTKALIPELHANSHPIRVISKPEQLRKKDLTHKKTVNETIIDIITKIEQTQSEHTKVLGNIFSRVKGETVLPIKFAAPPVAVTARPAQAEVPTKKRGAPAPSLEFETHFSAMLKAYQSLPEEQRGAKARKLATDLSAAETSAMQQLIDQLDVQEPMPFSLNISTSSIMRGFTSSNTLSGGLNTSQDMPKNFADLVSDYLF